MRRQLLRSVTLGLWVTPIIEAVMLPAHATTSICSESRLVGIWLYEGTDYGITLYKDGISDAGLGGGSWSVDGLKIRIYYDGVDHLIIGELMQNCTRIEGIEINQCCPEGTSQKEVVLVKQSL